MSFVTTPTLHHDVSRTSQFYGLPVNAVVRDENGRIFLKTAVNEWSELIEAPGFTNETMPRYRYSPMQLLYAPPTEHD